MSTGEEISMEKFTKTAYGYDPNEVNRFLDNIIKQVSKMVNLIKEKDEAIKMRDQKILELQKMIARTNGMREKIAQYERMESTLNKAIIMAQKTSDQIKQNAYRESEMLMENAKKNASRIVNEALMEAERAELEANRIRRNIIVYKRKLKDLLQAQLDMIEDIEKVNF